MRTSLWVVACFLGLGVLQVAPVAADAVVQSVKQDRIKQPDFRKYHPTYGAMSGESFFLHYCLPEFVPRGEGNCKAGIPGSIPDTIQVKYQYSLGKDFKRPLLEGGGWFVFPFSINADADKTPYIESYITRADAVKSENKDFAAQKITSDNTKHKGLAQYMSTAMPNNFRWWVPENRSEYITELGNPPVFSCFHPRCTLTLDLGNGWEARATFNEAALLDWRNFFVRFKASTKDVMEKYYGI